MGHAPENAVWVATVSAICEPWVFRRFYKSTLPANCAVGVATNAFLIDFGSTLLMNLSSPKLSMGPGYSVRMILVRVQG